MCQMHLDQFATNSPNIAQHRTLIIITSNELAAKKKKKKKWNNKYYNISTKSWITRHTDTFD